MSRPKMALVTPYDAQNSRNWSGIPYYLSRALEEFWEIHYVGPLHAESHTYATPIWTPESMSANKSLELARLYGSQIAESLSNNHCDLVFSIGAWHIAYLETELPLVVCADATFARLIDYHPTYRNLSTSIIQRGMMLEHQALSRCQIGIFASSWAAQSAAEYFLEASRVHVVPFGANLPEVPKRDVLDRRPRQVMSLVSVGTDWHWKGMDIAVDVVLELKRRGFNSRLTVCGCAPPQPLGCDVVRVYPYLDKLKLEDWLVFSAAMGNADFFILPTRAECYGIVFAEAAAYGLITLAPRTGGIPTIVIHGETGLLMSPDADAKQYVEAVLHIWSDHSLYEAMRQKARKRYEEVLNWRCAAREITALCYQLI